MDDASMQPVMADRRHAAEAAADAALATLEPGDDLGNGLTVTRRAVPDAEAG